ncbi:MAG: exodeoxyribonuclease III [Rhodospirillales bacterium]|nr:exodeoxyribonuclease III [Rhodospirillales bacterium]MCW9001942.1 exodeoxyribonuclease III [Rhodospirillales bacterium]MCW9038874.1 exodeoxyribonuclease III [Rhodospirillales bacterium]
MRIKITTWNVNSVRLRLDHIARLVAHDAPDVLCLQETKVIDPLFPHDAISDLGFSHRLVHGMKGYNGVAILSRLPLEPYATRPWCGSDDRRYLAATLAGGIEIHNFYVPAGGDVPDPDRNPKFATKLRFLDELAEWSKATAKSGGRRVLVGDLNVAPLESDVWSHARLKNVVTHTPAEVDRLNAIMDAGNWTDAVRNIIPDPECLFTWWSYRAADWAVVNKGRRLDHIWVSGDLAGALADVSILREARGWERPSDHVPVSAILDV